LTSKFTRINILIQDIDYYINQRGTFDYPFSIDLSSSINQSLENSGVGEASICEWHETFNGNWFGVRHTVRGNIFKFTFNFDIDMRIFKNLFKLFAEVKLPWYALAFNPVKSMPLCFYKIESPSISDCAQPG
jgi:hypothetical protein